LKDVKDVAALRGKTVEELLGLRRQHDMGKIKITLTHSPLGYTKDQQLTVRGIGFT